MILGGAIRDFFKGKSDLVAGPFGKRETFIYLPPLETQKLIKNASKSMKMILLKVKKSIDWVYKIRNESEQKC